jgi:hypothetical protein
MKNNRNAMLIAVVVIFVGALSVNAQKNLLQNSNFEKYTKDGKITAWKVIRGKTQIKEGINKSKGLATTLDKDSKKPLKSTISQKISLTPGKYILSGYIKGDVHALWVVLQYGYNRKTDPKAFTIWIAKNKLKKSEYPGWLVFTSEIQIPEKVKTGQMVLEPFFSKAGGVILLDNIKLISQED